MDDLADEYRNIKAYCRKEAAKSFKHPMAKQETAAPAEATEAVSDLSDAELDSMLADLPAEG